MLLYDGSPGHPDMNALWRFAEATGMNLFGTSAAYVTACMKAGIEPGREVDLSALKCVGATDSPLSPEGGVSREKAANPDSMSTSQALRFFEEYARAMRA